jgi:prevent-host-death family protein
MNRAIKASEFKAKCLALLDEVERTGLPLTVTKKGKPVADLVPHRTPKPNARGILKDELFVIGDIISPIDVEWEALNDSARHPRGSLVHHGRRPRQKKSKNRR